MAMDREEKREQFNSGKKSNLPWIVLALLVVIGLAVAGWTVAAPKGGFTTVAATGGQIAIPLHQVSDGKAHYFSYKGDGATVNFFVLKSSDGVIRAAFDTCDVCYRAKKGYRQEGNDMVCNNCDMRFASDKINEVKGGCNPAPLERTTAGGQLLIAEADVAAGARYFRNQ
jgi:uncharacterized membrane protein